MAGQFFIKVIKYWSSWRSVEQFLGCFRLTDWWNEHTLHRVRMLLEICAWTNQKTINPLTYSEVYRTYEKDLSVRRHYFCLLLVNTIWVLFTPCTLINKYFKISIKYGKAYHLFKWLKVFLLISAATAVSFASV